MDIIEMIRMVGLFFMVMSPAFYADRLKSFADVWKSCIVAILIYIGFSLVLSLIEYLVENHRREVRKEMIYAEIMGMKKERQIRERLSSQHTSTERKTS